MRTGTLPGWRIIIPAVAPKMPTMFPTCADQNFRLAGESSPRTPPLPTRRLPPPIHSTFSSSRFTLLP